MLEFRAIRSKTGLINANGSVDIYFSSNAGVCITASYTQIISILIFKVDIKIFCIDIFLTYAQLCFNLNVLQIHMNPHLSRRRSIHE